MKFNYSFLANSPIEKISMEDFSQFQQMSNSTLQIKEEEEDSI